MFKSRNQVHRLLAEMAELKLKCASIDRKLGNVRTELAANKREFTEFLTISQKEKDLKKRLKKFEKNSGGTEKLGDSVRRSSVLVEDDDREETGSELDVKTKAKDDGSCEGLAYEQEPSSCSETEVVTVFDFISGKSYRSLYGDVFVTQGSSGKRRDSENTPAAGDTVGIRSMDFEERNQVKLGAKTAKAMGNLDEGDRNYNNRQVSGSEGDTVTVLDYKSGTTYRSYRSLEIEPTRSRGSSETRASGNETPADTDKRVVPDCAAIITALQANKCKICRKTFRTESGLLFHRQAYHQDMDMVRHSCVICKKGFLRESQVKRHMGNHSQKRKEKQFSCKFCESWFVRNCDKVSHERIHTGEKPFTCSLCLKRFPQMCQLTSHLRIHMSRFYSCESCGKEFPKLGPLRSHLIQCHGAGRTTSHATN